MTVQYYRNRECPLTRLRIDLRPSTHPFSEAQNYKVWDYKAILHQCFISPWLFSQTGIFQMAVGEAFI